MNKWVCAIFRIPREPKLTGFIPCGNCKHCKSGYMHYTTELTLYHRREPITWIYTRTFSCDSLGILYVLKCRICTDTYLGKAKSVKSRVSKHISDVRHPHNSQCRKCTDHLREHSKLKEPFFYFFPFYYVEEPGLRHFMETRFKLRWKPTLNVY